MDQSIDTPSSKRFAVAIENRSYEAREGKVSAKAWAQRDADDFANITDPTDRQAAGLRIALQMTENRDYSKALLSSDKGAVVASQVREIETMTVASALASQMRKRSELDQIAAGNVSAARKKDTEQALKEMGLNSIEGKKTRDQSKEQGAPRHGDNGIESDEIFTPTKTNGKDAIPPEVEREFIRVGDKFHFANKPSTVAFEDHGTKLETKTDNENVASAMVKVALARGWDEIKVTGSETFKREVWFEGAARGMSVKGYTPNDADKARLEIAKGQGANADFRARENQIEPSKLQEQTKNDAQVAALAKAAASAKSMSEADIKAKVGASHLTPAQKEIVLHRVHENIEKAAETAKPHTVPNTTTEFRTKREIQDQELSR